MRSDHYRLIYFSCLLFATFAVVSISATQLAVFLIFVLAVFFRNRIKIDENIKLVFYLFACFFALYLITSIISVNPPNSFRKLKDPVWFLIFVPVYSLLKDEDKEKLLKVLVISSAVVTVLALSREIFFFGRTFRYFKLKSFTGHSIAYGCMMAMMFFINAALIIKEPKKVHFYITAAIIFMGLLLSHARGAWFGFLVGLIIFLILSKNLRFFILITLIFIGFISIPSRFARTFRSAFSKEFATNSLRLELWNWGLRQFLKRPFSGVGPNNIRYTIENIDRGDISDFTYEQRLTHLHNVPINLAAIMGIWGILLYLLYLYTFYKIPFSALKKRSDIRYIAIISTFTACFVTGLFEYNIFDSEITMLSAFILAMVGRE